MGFKELYGQLRTISIWCKGKKNVDHVTSVDGMAITIECIVLGNKHCIVEVFSSFIFMTTMTLS